MNCVRIIPRLDIKGPNLVKGIHLEGLRVLGKPEDFAKFYYENGADELLYMDVVASLYERNSLHDIITRTAREVFIPLTVGGGLRSIEDITKVLRAGADKVALNTAAIKNPELVLKASEKFGASTIVIAIEAMKQSEGKYSAYTDNGREYTGVDVVEWAQKVQNLGAGEILLTSVDKEGTGMGYDDELIKLVSDSVSIPVIAHGGASTPENILNTIKIANPSALAIASVFHYDAIKNHSSDIDVTEEGNVDFIKSGRAFSKIEPMSIKNIKSYLNSNGISLRM